MQILSQLYSLSKINILLLGFSLNDDFKNIYYSGYSL